MWRAVFPFLGLRWQITENGKNRASLFTCAPVKLQTVKENSAGASWNTTDTLLLSLATSTSRKFTPPHTAGIKLIFIQPWHQVQPALECLQAVYYSQRKLHYEKLVSTSCKILFQHGRKNVAFQQEFTDLGGKYVV